MEWGKSGSRFSEQGNPNAYDGFYSISDAKEIVAYTAQRGIIG